MKKLVNFSLLLFLSTLTVYPRYNWVYQNLPSGSWGFTGMSFIDSKNGVIVGSLNGIFYTSNGGENWERPKINPELPENSILQDVFLSKDGFGFIVGASGLILKTSDSGKTWSKINFISNDYLIKVFCNNNTIWILSNKNDKGRVYYSNDLGESWSIIENIDFPILQSIYFVNSNNGFICGYGKIYKTTNGGKDWKEINLGPLHSIMDAFFLNDFLGWFVGGTITKHPFLLRTTNGGETFDTLSFPYTEYLTSCFFIDSLQGFVTTFSGKIFSTLDGGISWDLDFSNPASNAVLFKIFFIGSKGWAIGNYNMVLFLDLSNTSFSPDLNFEKDKVFFNQDEIIEVYDLLGRQILTTYIDSQISIEDFKKSTLSQLISGYYFLRIRNLQKSLYHYQKLIILK